MIHHRPPLSQPYLNVRQTFEKYIGGISSAAWVVCTLSYSHREFKRCKKEFGEEIEWRKKKDKCKCPRPAASTRVMDPSPNYDAPADPATRTRQLEKKKKLEHQKSASSTITNLPSISAPGKTLFRRTCGLCPTGE